MLEQVSYRERKLDGKERERNVEILREEGEREREREREGGGGVVHVPRSHHI